MVNMRHNLEKLNKLLLQEVEVCKSISELLDLEKEAVVNFNPDQILCTTHKKETMVLKHEVMLKARESLIYGIYESYGLTLKDTKLRDFLGEIKDLELRDGLLEALDELFVISQEISEKNDINRRFVEHSLGYIHNTVHLLRGHGLKKKTYNAYGKFNSQAGMSPKGLRF